MFYYPSNDFVSQNLIFPFLSYLQVKPLLKSNLESLIVVYSSYCTILTYQRYKSENIHGILFTILSNLKVLYQV